MTMRYTVASFNPGYLFADDSWNRDANNNVILNQSVTLTWSILTGMPSYHQTDTQTGDNVYASYTQGLATLNGMNGEAVDFGSAPASQVPFAASPAPVPAGPVAAGAT